VARRMKSIGVETIYDIADNNPEMIRNSPQIPYPLRPVGGFFGDMMLRRNIRIARRIIYVTTAIKESCHIPEHKSNCIPNGVDTSLFRNHPSEQLRKELGLTGKFVIGYVGVLREWVKLEPIFTVVRQLEESHSELRVLIVGQEGRFQENKDLAKAYGIADKVIFTGTVPYAQVPGYISCMDVCTVPFEKNRVTNDPCPLKLFEYMACERPVISALEIMSAGNNILHAFSTEEYRNRILELYGDQALRRTLGTEGRRFVEQNYDWVKISSNLEKILTDVAS
jgi:glycosyltransferase involved in cell wall biosynthesis